VIAVEGHVDSVEDFRWNGTVNYGMMEMMEWKVLILQVRGNKIIDKNSRHTTRSEKRSEHTNR
jgi:hypothetical protein